MYESPGQPGAAVRVFNSRARQVRAYISSGDRQIASRKNSAIDAGCRWMIAGRSTGTRPARAVNSSAFSPRNSTIFCTRSAVGGSQFPCSICEKVGWADADQLRELPQRDPLGESLLTHKAPQPLFRLGLGTHRLSSPVPRSDLLNAWTDQPNPVDPGPRGSASTPPVGPGRLPSPRQP